MGADERPAICLAFFWPPISATIFVAVALVWLVPDRRIERILDAVAEDK
jgi:hypothetical protein